MMVSTELRQRAYIAGIEYHVPAGSLSNEQLASQFPEWSIEKIEAKTGIRKRHIAAAGECASDLAVEAAQKLLANYPHFREKIDFLLLCTQSPDYFLPATACVVQDRLGLSRHIGAIDINQGCSGFVYGLSLAKGLVETGQARAVLLVTAETYSKYINPLDKSVRTLFGDAAAATLVAGAMSNEEMLGPFVFGTDGSGAGKLIVPDGGCRNPHGVKAAPEIADDSGNVRSSANLYMDGPSILQFTLSTVPKLVSELQARSGSAADSLNYYVFHQANKFMLESLRRKIGISPEKFIEFYADVGNTVSCTIPIALAEASRSGKFKSGDRIMLVGFGVGLSWAGCMARWGSPAAGP